jgi:integrase
MVRTGATFADAAAEYLRYVGDERACRPSTLRDYRSIIDAHLLPRFGSERIEDVTPAMIDEWRASLGAHLSSRTKNKLLVVLHGIFRRAQTVWKLPMNPAAGIEKYRQRSSGDIEVFSPEEVLALVRAAGDAQDAAIYLTAAFSGLRCGELLALRWRDVDFVGQAIRVRASYAGGQVTSPKSGKVRSVPMAPDVATTLAGLGQRERWTGDDDLVVVGTVGGHVDGSALRGLQRARRARTTSAASKPPGLSSASPCDAATAPSSW